MEPPPLDQIKAGLAELYSAQAEAAAKGDVRRVAELQSQIIALMRGRQ